jgi:MerR family transcriptional regulator, heat shock protein HspR
MKRSPRTRPVYMISVAAELAGVHPQTLRIYERKELVQPQRSSGNTRLYSDEDIDRLRFIQQLTQEEGINLAGVMRIIEMQRELEYARAELDELRRAVAEREERARRQERVRQVRTALVHVRSGAVVRHKGGDQR